MTPIIWVYIMANIAAANWGRLDNLIVQPVGVAPVPSTFGEVSLKNGIVSGFTVSIVPPSNLASSEAFFYRIDYGAGGFGTIALNNFTRRPITFSVPGSYVRASGYLQIVDLGAPGATRICGIFFTPHSRTITYPPAIQGSQISLLAGATTGVSIVGRNARAILMTSWDDTLTPLAIRLSFQGPSPGTSFLLPNVSSITSPIRIPDATTTIGFDNTLGLVRANINYILIEEL